MSDRLFLGDCLDVLPTLPSASVDLVLADMPYGTTDCAWDSQIDTGRLWPELRRVLRDDGAIIMTASQPFTSVLVTSNLPWFRCEWIWKKNAGSNFGTVKRYPMKEHESALLFAPGKFTYNPIMQERAPSGAARVKTVVNYDTSAEVYQKGGLTGVASSLRPELRYPSSVQLFNRERGLHPTQKPVALCEYLIRTYSNPGDLVLDFCMGSGTTGAACRASGRGFIGIEMNADYFEIAQKRLGDARSVAA